MLFGVHGVGRVWCKPWIEGRAGWPVAGDPEWIQGKVAGPLTAITRGWAIELSAWTPEGRPCHLWREGNGWTKWTGKWT